MSQSLSRAPAVRGSWLMYMYESSCLVIANILSDYICTLFFSDDDKKKSKKKKKKNRK